MIHQLLGTSPTGGGEETEEEKSIGYPERALSLLRDVESIRDQAEDEDTAAADDDKGKEEEDDN